jgi:protocadherin Fat 1/2/3
MFDWFVSFPTRVNARDRDSGDNARISYSIANIDADDIPFEIDHFSGVIKSRKVIDYESDRREYRLLVREVALAIYGDTARWKHDSLCF